ncbi:hypothetical protein [Phenylobacterium sp. 58.2.17]|uniref:hypothetical protein n=1 Tax=Phenylobacterium sp. 58.2.17 TaxID=2969306 RepID=UPI002263C50F|nr:hypothetical protein [Phenylobacterium sp. 58.2.17]MCX7588370.1 hypothetical protein [Phenylobacterium sp. 58.2.17]
MEYDYFQLTLGRERTAQKVLADHLYGSAGVQAVFAPLLGFASDQALVLAAAGARVSFTPGVTASDRVRLTPTLRPLDEAPPQPGGIYVHNWFTIDGGAVDEFVRLSGEAWPDFEARFETKIFGLFLAEEDESDREAGARRLLLMTRYRDLGEWQTSRDPTTDAMAVFLRRRELTRVSLARACVLMPREGAN